MKINIHTNISDDIKEDEIEIQIKAKCNSNTLNKIIENPEYPFEMQQKF